MRSALHHHPSLSLTFLFSLSLAAGAITSTNPNSKRHFLRQFKPKSSATTSDLLSLLASPQQASSVNAYTARQLKSCFKFIVPFDPTPKPDPGRRVLAGGGRSEEEENEAVWWPPVAVMELARIAVDSGGDVGAIQRALDPAIITVPDIEGSKENRCELTRTPYGRHFISEDLNSYLEFLFNLIVVRGPEVGLNVSLNRYDFFHGHIFLASDSGRLGILFHAKEYPAFDKKTFPYNMGYCQTGSNVKYDDSMNLRNILWLAPLPDTSTRAWLAPGVLVVLDACPDGIIYEDLIPYYARYVRTLYEEDFGDIVADVNYLNCGGATPQYEIFIC
ncbi:uncharacterized protein LOC141664825 [Apium graveolens]|uniref:uncharacterized protein LOC141664825 n=1 Tax=Apium graveolens TaxID=4045 RepID=UPI003D7A9ECA